MIDRIRFGPFTSRENSHCGAGRAPHDQGVSGHKTRHAAVRTLILLLALTGVAACGDDDSQAAECPMPRAIDPAKLPPDVGEDPTDSELDQLEGTVVVLDSYDDGQPRQLGIAIEPVPGETVYTVEGRELVWFPEGALSRRLADHIGRQVLVRGTIVVGHSFLRAIHLRSYEVDGETVDAPASDPLLRDTSIEGTIVVLERNENGHPHILGIAADACSPIAFEVTNKSSELRFRIGRRMRVDGFFRSQEALTVVAYAELEGNPVVAAGDGFRLSFLAGGEDENGNFMGGVEVDTLIAFDGRIFAGTSYSKNTQRESPDPTPPGSQVLVLDRPDGRWRVDFTAPDDTDGSKSKIKFLDVVRFETDHTGRPLDPPVEMLAGVSGNGDVYLRAAGEPGQWYATGVGEVVEAASDPGRRPDARSVVSHTDPLTGISHLFAGVGIGRRAGAGGGIYRGSYDPSLPGLIAWAPEAEFPIADGPRPMGLAEIDGAVYASVGPQLLRRQDGPVPSWTEVLFYLNPFRADSVRTATGIRGPNGGSSLLVGIENIAGAVVRVDLDSGDASTEELSFSSLFPGTTYTIVAYNGPETRLLEDGGEIALLGLEMTRIRTTAQPEPEAFDLGSVYEFTDGLFVWRDPDGAYRVNRIVDPTLEIPPPLVGPRTILAHSPFVGEEDVLYFGGFDHNGHLFHNTGWIFKAHLEDVIRGGVSLPKQQASAESG